MYGTGLLNQNYRGFPWPSTPPPPPRHIATIGTKPRKITVVADVHYSASRGLLPIISEEQEVDAENTEEKEVDDDGYARVSLHGHEESNGDGGGGGGVRNNDALDPRGTLLSAAQNI